MKKLRTALACLTLAAVLALPVLADAVKAQVKSVDATANTITVTQNNQDLTVAVTADTKFVDAKGAAIKDGIKSGDLKPGANLAITYDKQGDKSVASEVQLSDVGAETK